MKCEFSPSEGESRSRDWKILQLTQLSNAAAETFDCRVNERSVCVNWESFRSFGGLHCIIASNWRRWIFCSKAVDGLFRSRSGKDSRHLNFKLNFPRARSCTSTSLASSAACSSCGFYAYRKVSHLNPTRKRIGCKTKSFTSLALRWKVEIRDHCEVAHRHQHCWIYASLCSETFLANFSFSHCGSEEFFRLGGSFVWMWVTEKLRAEILSF